ncbi:MAG: hypothetical protein H0W72_00605 [Planctomycetes bacterium]|nr:hypothetical protein [Planctomycetota bacterium]
MYPYPTSGFCHSNPAWAWRVRTTWYSYFTPTATPVSFQLVADSAPLLMVCRSVQVEESSRDLREISYLVASGSSRQETVIDAGLVAAVAWTRTTWSWSSIASA